MFKLAAFVYTVSVSMGSFPIMAVSCFIHLARKMAFEILFGSTYFLKDYINVY